LKSFFSSPAKIAVEFRVNVITAGACLLPHIGIPGERCAEARGPKALVSPEREARVGRDTPSA